MGGRPSPQLLVEGAARRGQFQDALRVLRATLPVLPPQAALAAYRADLLARTWPARALAASAALHVLFVFVPLPEFLTRAPAVPAGVRALRNRDGPPSGGDAPVLPAAPPPRTPRRPPAARKTSRCRGAGPTSAGRRPSCPTPRSPTTQGRRS